MGLRTLALCAGIGGLELGLRRVLPTRVVCWVERDPYAQRVLVARMQDGRLDDAPIWDDLTTFDAAAWRGQCDLVAAGFPCQPYSTAGKKLGADDPRDLWAHVARVVAESGASVVCLENVARLVRAPGGLGRVLRDLAALGFDAEWGVVRASDAGAPHRRARLFLLAVSDAGRVLLGEQQGRVRRERPERLESKRTGAAEPGDVGAERLGDPCGKGLARTTAEKADERCGSWPPGPSDRDEWEEVIALRPDLEPSVCGVAHGAADGLDRDSFGKIPNRRQRIRCLGNAVVPAQAALAFGELVKRVTGRA